MLTFIKIYIIIITERIIKSLMASSSLTETFSAKAMSDGLTDTYDNGLKVMDSALATHAKMDGGVGIKITDSLGDVASVRFMSEKNLPGGLMPFKCVGTAEDWLKNVAVKPTSLPDATKTMSFTRGAS